MIRSVASLTCSSAPIGDRLADHRRLRDAPLPVRLAALHHDAVRAPQPDRRHGNAGTRARAARFPTCPPSARGRARSCPRGTPRRTHLAATRRPRHRARAPRSPCRAAPGSGARRAAASRAGACRTARPWRGTGAAAPAVGDIRERQRVEVRDVIAREDHRPGARDAAPHLRSSTAARSAGRGRRRPSPRNRGHPRPVAYARHAQAALASRQVRAPQGSSSRCGRSASARRASLASSTTTRASRSRNAWPRPSSPPPATATDRRRVERAGGRGVVRSARAGAARRSRFTRRRGRRRPRWVRDRGLDPCRRRARRPAARDRRSTTSPATAPPPIAVLVPDHRDDGTPVLRGPGRRAVHVRLRPRFVRAPRRGRARAPDSRCGSCATPRSASTSTSPRISARLDVTPAP